MAEAIDRRGEVCAGVKGNVPIDQRRAEAITRLQNFFATHSSYPDKNTGVSSVAVFGKDRLVLDRLIDKVI